MGAALVARNIAVHLDGALSQKLGSFSPLIYCWRGGQRSASMAIVLDQIGWRPTVLRGGYKTYRKEVRERLHDRTLNLKLVLLGGHTGTAKTAVLEEVRALGGQVVDLEGLARHRGSLFGEMAGKRQPHQRMFESNLLTVLANIDQGRPVLIEAELSKIGSINVPEQLWKSMSTAPLVELRAPLSERARYLAEAYCDIAADRERMKSALDRLPVRHGRKVVDEWLHLLEVGAHRELAGELINLHYDPAYSRWSRSYPRASILTVEMEDLSPASRRCAARKILVHMDGLEPK